MDVIVPQGAVTGQTLDISIPAPAAALTVTAATTAVAPSQPQLRASAPAPATFPSAAAPATFTATESHGLAARSAAPTAVKGLMQASGSQMLAEAGALSAPSMYGGDATAGATSGRLLQTVGELKHIAEMLAVKLKQTRGVRDNWRPGHPEGARLLVNAHHEAAAHKKVGIGGAIQGALEAEKEAALIVDGIKQGRTV
jgi:hypothetical protein